MKRLITIAARCCIAAVAITASSLAAAASAYPAKPVSLVVVFGPGGTSDIVARLVGDALGNELKQQVVVENRPGAGGNIGASYVARATPDGYTLLAAFPGLTTNGALYSKLNYNPSADFAPISRLASAPNVIVVGSSLPVKTLDELLKYARSRSGEMNFGSAGAGSSSHLAGELLGELAGLKLTHIPYKGGAPALTDLAAGRLDVMVIPLPEAYSLIQSGKIKPLALASPNRSTLLPDVPTTKEAGLANFEVGSWYGLMAPAGTPADVIEKLSAATTRALRTSAIKEAFEKRGIDLVGDSPSQFKAFLGSETDRWAAVIKNKQIKLD